MRKLFLLSPLVLFALVFEACSTFLFWEKPDYVKVNGTQFIYDGKPYYYVGTNMWDGCYLGSSGKTGDRPRLIRELDDLKAMGITNLRILGASEDSYIENSLKPAIQLKPGIYDENLLEGLDFLLAEMDKRDMHGVIFLNNYWEWSGGMAQYNDWANGGGGVDAANGNYPAFMDYSASFYNNSKAQKLFFNYLTDILTRKNKYDGYYYYEEPAIMAWELANEPRPGRDDKYLTGYYRWIDTTAHFIHGIDPNHLVTTGNEGLAGSLGDSAIYLTAQASKYIDYVTFHLWPKNWGWFNAKDIAGTYSRTESNAINYIDQHIGLARVLGKPTVMEEFGVPRDSELCVPGTPTTARDKYYKKIMGLIYDSAAVGAPIAGTNFWGWGGEGRGQHFDNKWQPGDPFTGDPPQEPQGLNSVYDVDSTTLSILKRDAEQMIMLSDIGKIIGQIRVAQAEK
jgi:mannan endo-1,4-beta-mannosidase